jgi:hypothetical protein
METILRQQERPDVSIEQRRTSEVVKRIRKLRWMGLEGRGVETVLTSISPTDCVLAAPHEAD